MKNYTHEEIKKIASKISKIKNKKILIKIYKLIKSDPKVGHITENSNGLFLHFHNLSNNIYKEIDEIITSYNNKNIKKTSIHHVYTPYSHDEFPSQEYIAPKLKYSNKEKNLLKRDRYNKYINSENNSDNIVYSNFSDS